MNSVAGQDRISLQPTLGVITVCRNALEDLKLTTASVQSQTASGIVHIVVDGASVDGTPDWLRAHQHLFTAAISEPDKSIQDAYNKALDLCPEVTWFVFMNAGDAFQNAETVASFIDQLRRKDVDFIFGAVEIRDAVESNPVKRYPPRPHATTEMPGCHQSTFVRASVMRQLKFDLDYRVAADLEVWLRATHKAGSKTAVLDRVIATIAPEGYSARNEQILQNDYVRAISKHLSRFQALTWLAKRKVRRAVLAIRAYILPNAK
jgi:glycosyltransferase involved in cell wall biosynthesis